MPVPAVVAAGPVCGWVCGWLVPGGMAWSAIVGMVALAGGLTAARRWGARDARADALLVAADGGGDMSETARCLLLGRITGGIAQELGQSLNVIVMANGNLGYVLDRAALPEPDATQMRERVRKIATHGDAAALMLNQLRWFGRDGAREGSEMTVGTALERAIAVTRVAARRCGVAVEMRGDALSHPLPRRHGVVEMMATAALLEMLQQFAARPAGGEPPHPVVLEATRTQREIEISLLTRSRDCPRPRPDEVAQATYDLVARLAVACRGEWRRVAHDDDPVHHMLRLDRDMV